MNIIKRPTKIYFAFGFHWENIYVSVLSIRYITELPLPAMLLHADFLNLRLCVENKTVNDGNR